MSHEIADLLEWLERRMPGTWKVFKVDMVSEQIVLEYNRRTYVTAPAELIEQGPEAASAQIIAWVKQRKP